MCGDTANGFVALWNWGRLGDGTYTAVVYDNGVEFARTTFTVVTPGEEFLFGATGSGTATLSTGQQATLKWSQASQNFVVTNYTNPGGGTPPPPVARGVGQFLGTWQLTNSITTQTYRFRECPANTVVKPCVADLTRQTYLWPTALFEGLNFLGHSYYLADVERDVCRVYLLYEPNGNRVRGHYGYTYGNCISNSAISAIAEDLAYERYPTIGTHISNYSSQEFRFEAEEEMGGAVKDGTQKDGEGIAEAIGEELLLLTE